MALDIMHDCRISVMVKAHGHISSREFASAVTTLKSLDTKPLLRDNSDLLTILGETYFYNGDLTSACATLQRVTVIMFRYNLLYNEILCYCPLCKLLRIFVQLIWWICTEY